MRVLLALLLLGAAASAQPPPPPQPVGGPVSVGVPDGPSEVERAVAATVAEPGVHVVHFWAPWCGNSRAEFEAGFYEVVEAHPDVTFSFVTMWNEGDAAADRLARYGIAEGGHVRVYGQPTPPWTESVDERRRTFLGLPVTWTPTTWVFNREGHLAYAFNYGEVSPETLAQAIDDAAAPWLHD